MAVGDGSFVGRLQDTLTKMEDDAIEMLIAGGAQGDQMRGRVAAVREIRNEVAEIISQLTKE